MPIPSPKDNETQEEFISRCMGNPIMLKEYPDQKQRAGVCYSAWRDKKMEEEKDLCQELDELARGQGQGVGGPRQGDGGATECVCPECGEKVKHERGTPCNQVKCPKCGTPMQGA